MTSPSPTATPSRPAAGCRGGTEFKLSVIITVVTDVIRILHHFLSGVIWTHNRYLNTPRPDIEARRRPAPAADLDRGSCRRRRPLRLGFRLALAVPWQDLRTRRPGACPGRRSHAACSGSGSERIATAAAICRGLGDRAVQ